MPYVAPTELLEKNRFPNDRQLARFKEVPSRNPDKYFPDSLARERGRLHGDHLKRAMAKMAPDNDGAIVYIDNESSNHPVPPTLITYWGSLFEEMRRPGSGDSDPPAVRPGLYTIEADFVRIIQRPGFEDVFIWRLDYDHEGTKKWREKEPQRP